MKNLIFIGAMVFLSACSSQKNLPADFISHFEGIIIDTMKVYSTDYIEADTFKFKGQQLDTLYFPLFQKEETELFRFNPVYACFKFSIDEQLSGLILRVPSEYVSSWVKLFVWENDSQKFIGKSIPLAEVIGDAGYNMEQCSWLFKSTKGFSLFTHVKECEYDLEFEEETEEHQSEAEGECTDEFALYTLEKGEPQKQSMSKSELGRFIKRFKINTIPSN